MEKLNQTVKYAFDKGVPTFSFVGYLTSPYSINSSANYQHAGYLMGTWMAEEIGKDLDPFDLICHVAFDQPPLTRRERAANVRKQDVFTKYGDEARAVLEALLQKYQDEGVTELDDPRILRITPFDTMGTPIELLNAFGGRDGFEEAVHELQSALYEVA